MLAKAELRVLDYAFLREFPLDSRENEFLEEFTENRQERDGPVVFREALVFIRFRKQDDGCRFPDIRKVLHRDAGSVD